QLRAALALTPGGIEVQQLVVKVDPDVRITSKLLPEPGLLGLRKQVEPRKGRADRVRLLHDELAPRLETILGSGEREREQQAEEGEERPFHGRRPLEARGIAREA